MRFQTDNIRISGMEELLPPCELIEKQPISKNSSKLVFDSRELISRIISRKDKRLITIVGPCSIHDPKAAIEYAQKLIKESVKYENELKIVMRVYFEKPRTTIGWKGLINDPDLNNSFKINKGLSIARRLLRDINDIGMSAATEFLDVITPQYVADLISWGAIGARTTESQIHRELTSGLSCPVGFKNTTEGNIQVAVDAIKSAQNSHIFLSANKEGKSAIFASTGNKDCHVILRGGSKPNYDSRNIKKVKNLLKKAGLIETVMIDMSHGNSRKQHKNQLDVCRNIGNQISFGEESITGVMIESNLVQGSQNLTEKNKLIYGKSITDSCIGWRDTEHCLANLAEAVSKRK